MWVRLSDMHACRIPNIGFQLLVVGHHLTWCPLGSLHMVIWVGYSGIKVNFISPRPHWYYTSPPEPPVSRLQRDLPAPLGAKRKRTVVGWARIHRTETYGQQGCPWNVFLLYGGNIASCNSVTYQWAGWCLGPSIPWGAPYPLRPVGYSF